MLVYRVHFASSASLSSRRSLAGGQHLGMLGRVAVGPYCIVACGNDRLTPLIDDQRAKRVTAVFARLARQLDRLP